MVRLQRPDNGAHQQPAHAAGAGDRQQEGQQHGSAQRDRMRFGGLALFLGVAVERGQQRVGVFVDLLVERVMLSTSMSPISSYISPAARTWPAGCRPGRTWCGPPGNLSRAAFTPALAATWGSNSTLDNLAQAALILLVLS